MSDAFIPLKTGESIKEELRASVSLWFAPHLTRESQKLEPTRGWLYLQNLLP